MTKENMNYEEIEEIEVDEYVDEEEIEQVKPGFKGWWKRNWKKVAIGTAIAATGGLAIAYMARKNHAQRNDELGESDQIDLLSEGENESDENNE